MPFSLTNKILSGLALVSFVPALLVALYAENVWLMAIPVGIVFAYLCWLYPFVPLTLLWISLPLSVEFSFSERLGTDLPDEPLMIIVTFLSLCYMIYQGRSVASAIWQHPLFLCFLGWLCWMIVATLFSTTPELSVKFLLAKSWYVGAFFIAPLIWLRSPGRITFFLRCLFIPLFLLGIFSVVRHAFEGFSFVSASAVAQPYFRNHVVYSAMLMTLVPLLFFSWRHVDRKRGWTLALGLVLIALFLSYARGAWLALIVGAVAYLLLRQRLLLYGYVVALLIGLLSLLWLKQNDRYLQYAPDYRTTIFHSDFRDHWRATYEGKDVSTVERFYRWIAGVRMVEERPVTGFGPASFYSAYRPFTVPAYKTWVSNNPDRSTVHNYFLLTAVEQGLPGLIVFLVLFGAILYYAERLYHIHRSTGSGSLAAGIGIVTVMLGVVNFWSDLIETDKIGSLFFLSIALLLILEREGSGRARSDVERIA